MKARRAAKPAHDYRRLDPLLASRIRLAAMALLATTEKAEFSFLREQTGASDGNLGAHMRKLVEAEYVVESKGFHDRRPKTSYCLTKAGRRALEVYLARLQRMLDAGAGP